jgi:hypothetical protein
VKAQPDEPGRSAAFRESIPHRFLSFLFNLAGSPDLLILASS